jgi:hypothetical protein
MAASSALPPRFMTSTATAEAMGCDVAAMPWRASTGLRLAKTRPV